MSTITKDNPLSYQTPPTGNVSDEIERLKADIARLTSDVKNVGSAMMEKSRAVATDKYEDASERVSSSIDSATRAVEERPVTSVLVALGAGVIIGKFLLDSRS